MRLERRSFRIAVVGVAMMAVMAVMPSQGAAQFVYTGCAVGSSSAFRACSSAEVSYDAATGTLVMNVMNLNESTDWNMEDYASDTGGWHTIHAVGLSNLVYSIGTGGLSLNMFYDENGDGTLEELDPMYWNLNASTLQIENTAASTDQGHLQGIVGAMDPGPANKEHLQTTLGSYVQFQISGFTDLVLADGSSFEWHSVQVAAENCMPSNGTEFSGDEECLTVNSLKGEAAVVPEPITLLLLGSGLAGVGGVAARKRRNEGLIETE